TNQRAAAEAENRPIGVLADLQGPKIRLGTFADGAVELHEDDEFVITIEDISGDADRVSTTYKGLPGDVRPGDRVLIDDGRIVLECTKTTSTDVHTRVIFGGPVSDHKGLNLPGVAVKIPALTEKDENEDRKSTRLNSSHVSISYAVYCLKKKR